MDLDSDDAWHSAIAKRRRPSSSAGRLLIIASSKLCRRHRAAVTDLRPSRFHSRPRLRYPPSLPFVGKLACASCIGPSTIAMATPVSTRVWESCVLPYPTSQVWAKLRSLNFAELLPSRVASSELVYGRSPDEGELPGRGWFRRAVLRTASDGAALDSPCPAWIHCVHTRQLTPCFLVVCSRI